MSTTVPATTDAPTPEPDQDGSTQTRLERFGAGRPGIHAPRVLVSRTTQPSQYQPSLSGWVALLVESLVPLTRTWRRDNERFCRLLACPVPGCGHTFAGGHHPTDHIPEHEPEAFGLGDHFDGGDRS